MSQLVVVQARMGSTRLFGKVLADVAGQPMLAFQLARLRTGAVAGWHIAVATSTDPRDDPIAELATALGVDVVRGSEHDVLSRFGDAIDRFPADDVVRLTGDCPLTDPAIVAAAVALHMEARADYTSNVYPRSYPKGLDVEVIAAEALRAAIDDAAQPDEREHVTPYIVRRPERFRLATLYSGEDLGEEWWTVDRAEDLDAIRQLVSRIHDPVRAGWRDILACAPPAPYEAGTVHLRPRPPPSPGSSPWVRTWQAERDGATIGTARVAVESGAATVTIDAAGAHDDVAAALERLLAGDVQITRRVPS